MDDPLKPACGGASSEGPTGTTISRAELVKLCAVDNHLFGRTFFPKAIRQKPPAFHRDIDKVLDDPRARFVNLQCFRGSAKTTKLRVFTGKRIAYNLSRTILYIGASEGHAVRTIQWLRSSIESKRGDDGTLRTPFFAETFGLRPGKKWTDTEIEVFHGIDDRPIWVLGVGITGNIRGINFDDFRPDLIVVDDGITDENAATEEQREKTTDLILSAVKNSLASEVEFPNAKMALLNTPLHEKDFSCRALEDDQWVSKRFGCWTPETKDSDVDQQVSSWEELFPTPALRADKKAAMKRNKLSLFLREMEVTLVAPETRPLRGDWLQYYADVPRGATYVLGVDPVPPASEIQLARGLAGKDYEVHAVVARHGQKYYLVEYRMNRGHDPDWSVMDVLGLAQIYRVSKIIVESVAYQRVLKWILEQAMKRARRHFPLVAYIDKRSKYNRITSAFGDVCPRGDFFIKEGMTEFYQQFISYRGGDGQDDILDAVAIALSELVNPYLELDGDEYADISDLPRIERKVFAP